MTSNRFLVCLATLLLAGCVVPLGVLAEGERQLLAKDCPLCDSSVYSYCSNKLLHDACCCLHPYETNLPYQCQFADCSFLHANTCEEHHLITRCCCNKLFIKK